MITDFLLLLVILLGLFFTFTNGFQDGSSVTACAISSRAITPLQTVCLVACFEFLGALFGGSAVAETIHNITSWPSTEDMLPVLISGLVAAISWNFITKRLGLPSSSTHALVGGVLGAVISGGGGLKYVVMGSPNHIMDSSGVWKVIISLFVSPLFGFLVGYLFLNVMTLFLIRATTHANFYLKSLQWPVVAILAFAHGANDTQKTMGIIMLSLRASGISSELSIPLWVRIICGAAMSLGIMALAPSIVRRVGVGIYRLRALEGLSAELASTSVELFGSLSGGPVSATQVVSSSVMGVGTAARLKAVRWLVAKDMFAAWFLTIPAAGLFSAALYLFFFQWLNGLLPR